MHVLFKQAGVIEGIMPLGVKLVCPAVEAGGRAVTEDSGVGAVAVGGLMFGHHVSTVPTVTTSFVQRAVQWALGCLMC